ncbi:MAG: LysR family transcriptional regulator ArgP [Enterobacteriaceae bacterium]|jgi:LysR family transcriptional regulator (chromosome initiation inhibitor)|nr:LysR family transcriptional regulator ArgP [Enterobacteriaceae bacterium]
MKNIDYKSLRLLDLIIKEQGFEKAASKLFITQSAVSQRVKQLENQVGTLLLTRTVPPKPTKYGEKLLGLLYHVQLIEHDMFSNDYGHYTLNIPISVNADSLATWVLPALKDFLEDSSIRLDIKTDDESRTLDYLIRGEVVGAISLQPLPIIGGRCDLLGTLDYIFVSTPSFAEKYFPKGVTQDALLKTPIVAFDFTSDMHHSFLQQYFGLTPGSLPCHIVGSSEAYIKLILQDSACCMISKQQIKEELASGKIINLVPNLVQHKKLYWHRYLPESETIKKMSHCIVQYANSVLNN